MSALVEFLYPAPAGRDTVAILAWWERRRLPFNAFVGAAGLVSLGSVGLLNFLAGGDDFFPQALALSAVFGVMANVCYLLGPAVELLCLKLWGRRVLPVGPALYRMGLTFSVGLALFPTMLAVLAMTLRLLLAVLGVHWY